MTRLKKFHAIGDFLHLLKQVGDISEDYTKSNILLQFRKKRRKFEGNSFRARIALKVSEIESTWYTKFLIDLVCQNFS